MKPRTQPIPNPKAAPAAPASLAAELYRAHILLMQTGAVANELINNANIFKGASPAGAALARVMAAQGMANLTARLGERLHGARRAVDRLAAKGLDPAALPLPSAPADNPATAAPATPARPKLHAAPGQARGRLRNGNPAGDYLAAPRCGARARSGCPCRQPAMANGRCRFHGGKSTGARTPEGLRRCRLVRFRHGGRSRPVIALRSRAAHAARRLRLLSSALSVAGRPRQPSIRASHPMSGENRAAQLPRMIERNPAGHGVDRSDCLCPPGGQVRPHLRSIRDHRVLSAYIGVHRRSKPLPPAGHGVDRSIFDFRPAPSGPAPQNPSTPPLRAA